MPSYDPRALRVIANQVRRYNAAPSPDLELQAVLANAHGEGGVKFGAVGDAGHSFGPFQLYDKGALPKGKNAAWANSPAGIAYAVRQMGQVAGGLKGHAALEAIVKKFERPENPDAQVAKRWSWYHDWAKPAGLVIKGKDPGVGPPAKTLAKASRKRSKAIVEERWVTTPGMTAQEKLHQKRGAILEYMAQSSQAIMNDEDPVSMAPLLNKINEISSAKEAERVLKRTKKFIQQDPLHDQTPDAPLPSRKPKTTVKNKGWGTGVVASGMKYLGVPYTWGGNDAKSGMDCSGLVRKVLAENGVDVSKLGRTTYDLVNAGTAVNPSKMQPGDTVFWDWGGRAGPEHTGFYIGDGKYLMASGRSGEIRGNQGGETKIKYVKDYAAPSAVRRIGRT